MTLELTPLHVWHKEQQAKMGEFAGWDMPIQYTGIIAEHLHTRTKAGIFDICHMGQFIVKGENASMALSKALTQNFDTLKVGKCRYGFLLTEVGTVLDDLIVYRLEEEKYLLVVNAGCAKSDFETIKKRIAPLSIEDITQKQGKIDLQGPLSLKVLEEVTSMNFHDLPYFSFKTIRWNNEELLVSRTGYTGELGYEIYVPRSSALKLWEELAKHQDVLPIGLGARDTLRLEAGLALYGHELDTKHTVRESSMAHMLTSTADYVGKEQTIAEPREVLIPLIAEGKRAARNNDALALEDAPDVNIGRIVSGSYAPSLNASIAFAFVEAKYANQTNFLMKAAKTTIKAQKTELPFYKEGSARIKL